MKELNEGAQWKSLMKKLYEGTSNILVYFLLNIGCKVYIMWDNYVTIFNNDVFWSILVFYYT